MAHPSHNIKCYTADPRKPLVFCQLCGKEEDEGLNNECSKTFYVDTKLTSNYPEFVSGLPDLGYKF